MKYLLIGLTVGLVGFGVATFYAYRRLASRLLVHVPADTETPADYGLSPTPVALNEHDRRLVGWYFEHPEPKGGVVLVHGLGWPKGGKAHMLAHAKYLYEAGYSSVAMDLYSFGESEGSRISLGSEEWQDVVVFFDYLDKRDNLAGKPVGLMGVSMGAVSSLIAAGMEGVGDFVIASVPYATIDGLMRQQIVLEDKPVGLFWPPMKVALWLLIADPIDPLDQANKVEVPILYLHGTRDNTLPAGDVENLAATTRNAELITIDAGHDIHAEKPEEFERVVLGFLNQLVLDEKRP